MSTSTVSRVINGRPFVRADVRDRVLAVSDSLGYRPDVAARSMRTGTTGMVGLVVSDISNPLFASIARAADRVLGPAGIALMVANSANDVEHEAELLAACRQRRLDGLMIATADERAGGLAERIGSFQAAVLLDREVPGAAADRVLSDHADGFSQAMRHLAGLGHRRIALIAGTPAQRGSRVRLASYRAEVERSGIDDEPRLRRQGEMEFGDGYRAILDLLALDDPPTAIVAADNRLFAGVFSAIRDLGIRVPAELSVVACEETELTSLHNPPLDVVSRDVEELGRVAAELLLERLETPRLRRREIVLPTRFEARGSSAPPAPPRRGRR